MGLPITDEQLDELRAHVHDINYAVAAREEKLIRHDVMAHVRAYGEQCPAAKGIIHLGATSCYVGDNTDLILMREGLLILRKRLLAVVARLADFAEHHQALPTLGFTHFQPAQLVTVGKRATLWIQDLLADLEELDFVLNSLKFLGSKGTTGTQASFMDLFEGDADKVVQLDRKIAAKFDFDAVYPVAGQTYSRKVDSRVLNVLSAIAQSAAKFSNDLRLLQHLKEIEEPFEAGQIGSSAMAYKRNPMRSERMASLARLVITYAQNPPLTAAAQWLERTLDDSANKRVSVPESFLACDAILSLYENVAGGLVVYPEMILRHVMAELPFMATENILMEGVKRGGDRQELHEKIRVHAMAAAREVKEFGRDNDLLYRIAADPAFELDRDELETLLAPERYTGRAAEQVADYLSETVRPLLAAEADSLAGYQNVELNV